MTYYADVTIHVTVAFEDESDLCLEDQAMEMVEDRIHIPQHMRMGMELVGPVRSTEDIVNDKA